MIAIVSENLDKLSYDEEENKTGLLKDLSSLDVYCQAIEKLKLIEKRMDKFKDLSNEIHKSKGKNEISTSLSGEYLNISRKRILT